MEANLVPERRVKEQNSIMPIRCRQRAANKACLVGRIGAAYSDEE